MTSMTPEQAAAAMRRMSIAIHAELQRAVPTLAQRVAVRMKLEAPKFRSTTTNSVEAHAEDGPGITWFIGPHTDYAKWVNKGRKPGKGLPRFFDPAAASAVAWLQAHLGAVGSAGPVNPRWRTARVGTRRRTQMELELRDRYMAWSRSVKRRGIKADPFVDRTAAAMAPVVTDGLVAAVRRGVQAARGSA